MISLFEKRLESIRLTTNQKKVMTRILAAPTEQVAAEQASKGRNLVAARDMLSKLGMIAFEEHRASVTDDGMEVMKRENLIDDMGELTEDGNEFAYDPGEAPPVSGTLESLMPRINESANYHFTPDEVQFLELVQQDKADIADDQRLISKLFDMYKAKMPAGVRDGDTGTPDVWLYDHVADILKDIKSSK